MTEHVDAPRLGSRAVVAVVVEWRGRIALLRRSTAVAHDQGLWHCVTGYIETGVTPMEQALKELHEETGLGVVDLESFLQGEVLELVDRHEHVWTVHTFRARTARRRLVLNAEHDAYRWVGPAAVVRFGNQVTWLEAVMAGAGVRVAAAKRRPARDRPPRTRGASPRLT